MENDTWFLQTWSIAISAVATVADLLVTGMQLLKVFLFFVFDQKGDPPEAICFQL